MSDLIKVDVEGHEYDVFKGCKQLFRDHKVKLLFECEQRHHSELDINTVFNYLEDFGYEGWYITENSITSLDQFDQVKLQENAWGNPEYVNNFIFEKKDS